MPIISDHAWSELPGSVTAIWLETLEREQLDLSLHPDWIEAIALARGVDSKLRVCMASDGPNSTLLPYLVRPDRVYGIPVRSLHAASNLVAYHPEAIGQALVAEVLRALLCSGKVGWDLFDIRNLSPDGATAAAVVEVAGETRLPCFPYVCESSPYVPLGCSWSDLLGSRSKKSRYNLKRMERRLREEGEVADVWYEQDADPRPLLDAMLAVEARSWKVRAGMAVESESAERQYYQKLLPVLVRLGALAANVLTLDNRPIAYSLCYRWRGRWAQLKTSFDDDLKDFSPGTIVNTVAIRKACDLGDKEFDFLGDEMPHKMMWTDNLRQHRGFYVYNRSIRGRLASGAKWARERLRA